MARGRARRLRPDRGVRRADLKDFLRRTGISDPASVTVRDIDSYATRMGLDGLDRDTRRRRLYT